MNDTNQYFNQIAELLLSNYEFIKDIKIIRKKYFRKINHRNQKYISYNNNFSILNDKELLSDFRKSVDSLMIKCKLTPRWRPYIVNKVFVFPIDKKNNKLKVPNHLSHGSPPNGEPGVIKVFSQKGELPSKFLLVGDEKEMDVKKKAVKHSIMDFNCKKTKQRKRSIDKFNTYIRWYRIYQKYLLNNKSEENIYLTILYSDIDGKKDKEWPTQYHQFFKLSRGDIRMSGIDIFKETEKLEKTGELVIKRAINLLEGIVYQRVK